MVPGSSRRGAGLSSASLTTAIRAESHSSFRLPPPTGPSWPCWRPCPRRPLLGSGGDHNSPTRSQGPAGKAWFKVSAARTLQNVLLLTNLVTFAPGGGQAGVCVKLAGAMQPIFPDHRNHPQEDIAPGVGRKGGLLVAL